jgi:hypothetical protein
MLSWQSCFDFPKSHNQAPLWPLEERRRPRLTETTQRPGLEWQLHIGQQIFDALDQLADRMSLCRVPKILGSEVYIYLRARDQPMPQQISHRHQTHTGLDQMRGKRMP